MLLKLRDYELALLFGRAGVQHACNGSLWVVMQTRTIEVFFGPGYVDCP
jgi:hypothetical protein